MTPKKRSPKHERVATILRRCVGSIVEDWLARAKKSIELNHLMLSDDERTGHLPKLIQDLIARLGKRGAAAKGSYAVSSAAATAHGKMRHEQGYTAAMLVHESRILQVTLFETLQNNVSFLDLNLLLSDVMTIADEVDAQLAQAMDGYINTMRLSLAA
jgi:hypothetical protein